jgi:hypothetical protein
MYAPKKLDSPIQLALHHRTAVLETPLPSIPAEIAVTQRESIKHGSPYDQLDRLFVGLHPSWNGIDAIEFTDRSLVGFVSHYSLQGKVDLLNPPQPAKKWDGSCFQNIQQVLGCNGLSCG